MLTSKQLLIIYHSQSGNTEKLAMALEEGAKRVEEVDTVRARAHAIDLHHIRDAHALVVCSPEYFGYMAGAIKDLFDRTYDHVREHMIGKSYTIVISAGNDGTGALNSIERIILGFRLRRVQDSVICKGQVTQDMLEKCRTLGHTLAAGISLGIY